MLPTVIAATWGDVGVAVFGLVVVFVGGGLGVILAAELRSRRERAEAWRTRQVDAAYEFASRVTLAIPAIRDAYDPQVDEKKIDEFLRLLDDAHASIARVELLFEPNSDTANEARLTVGALRKAGGALLPPADVEGARQAMYDADNYLRRFAARAHAVMRNTKFAEPPLGTPSPRDPSGAAS